MQVRPGRTGLFFDLGHASICRAADGQQPPREPAGRPAAGATLPGAVRAAVGSVLWAALRDHHRPSCSAPATGWALCRSPTYVLEVFAELHSLRLLQEDRGPCGPVRRGAHGPAGGRHRYGEAMRGRRRRNSQETQGSRAPKWETEGPGPAQRCYPPVQQAAGRPWSPVDSNEGDTRLLATDFLCDGLGFDQYADLTTEYQVKGSSPTTAFASTASSSPSLRSNGSPPSSRPATSARSRCTRSLRASSGSS